jgi:hypothetical protein
MDMPKKFVLAFAAALAAAGACHAQQIVTPPGQRILDERYFEVSYGNFEVSGLSDRGNAYSFSLSAPIVAHHVDLGLGYGVDRISDDGFRITENVFTASLAAYTEIHGFKPFVEAAFSADRVETKTTLGTTIDRITIASYGAGVQIPFKAGTITPSLSYTDSTEDNSSAYFNYGLQVDYPLIERLNGFFAYTYSKRQEGDSFHVSLIRLGLRYKY